MKPYFITLLLCSFILFVTACRKTTTEIPLPTEEAKTKTIELKIGKGQPFHESAFDYVVTTLMVSVNRVNRNSGASQTLWDTLIQRRHVRDFPFLNEVSPRTLIIPDVLESRDIIQLNWNSQYRDTVTNYTSSAGRQDIFSPSLQNWQVRIEL